MSTALTYEKWVRDEQPVDISHVILSGLSGVPAVTTPTTHQALDINIPGIRFFSLDGNGMS